MVSAVQQMIASNPTIGVQGTLIALATRTDTTPSLAKIQVPTLILVGGGRPHHTSVSGLGAAKPYRGSQMAVIPEAAHLSNLENPARLQRSSDDFS